jgi:hypothetical protein
MSTAEPYDWTPNTQLYTRQWTFDFDLLQAFRGDPMSLIETKVEECDKSVLDAIGDREHGNRFVSIIVQVERPYEAEPPETPKLEQLEIDWSEVYDEDDL